MSQKDLVFYAADGSAYQPVKHYNRASGKSAYRVKPRGASNKTSDFIEYETIEEVAKAMLIDGLPARVKSLDNSGPVSVLVFGGELLKRYELNPIIAQRLGVAAQSEDRSDEKAELAILKGRFLSMFPDFEERGAFEAISGKWYQTYRSRVDALLADPRLKTKDGWSVLEALLDASQGGRGSLPPFFEGDVTWRVKRVRDADPSAFNTALDRLIQINESSSVEKISAAINKFNETFSPLLKTIGQETTYRDTRIVPSAVLAATIPNQAVLIRYVPYSRIERLLHDRPLFHNAPITAKEYKLTIDLALEVKTALISWGWIPRDLWDIHGFILSTYVDHSDESARNSEDELLARFDRDERFRNVRSGWSEEQRNAFCSIVRTAHHAGLDWYHTNIPEIRCGRKSSDGLPAEGTIASVQLRKDRAFLQLSHQHEKVGLEGSFEFDNDGAENFSAAMEDALEEIANWQPPVPSRPGRWPNEYKDLGDTDLDTPARISPTNLILYGPPGTGKTYQTMEVAVRLCGELPAQDRLQLHQQYGRLRKERRIEFVTFHQNFAYEEFVEGLRPPHSSDDKETQEEINPGMILDVHSGIFRDVVDNALLERGSSALTLDPQRSVFKIALGDRGSEEAAIQEALDREIITLGWGGSIDWSAPKYEEFSAILHKWQSEVNPDATGKDSNVEQLFALRSWMQEGDYVVVSDGRDRFRAIGQVTGPYYFLQDVERHPHQRKVRWLWRDDEGQERSIFYPRGFRRHSLYRLDPNAIDWVALSAVVNNDADASTGTGRLPHVLIIDEINRANISKVFGELITLIEPDKRLGMPNALKVRLPYSKKDFGVPANLHIVGTMNTADRSIMQIDTALRRRFRFEEMEPNSTLLRTVDNIDLRRVLDTINARIEYLLDRDHAVGHAFFMGDGGKDRAAIDETMRFKIIPLLQEYFFDDWRNIAAVLGAGFVRGKTLAVPPGIEDRGERTRWTIRWQENAKSGFPENAYDLLLKGTEAEVDQGDSSKGDGMDDAEDEA
ncbi:AAA family ATPase [Qipengyuania marisflavi]|uniref:AAA+ ATPase domain-containing protein n=1 Tax=Qipengyuania marisflavi TaxID=2486356 RepID=A0A5S3NXT4_9SPHN|nr:AAA family ATPase [Qipengyuania marisflavi]TMM44977.1 hypothetical protein FEV51_12960 [Qipengyuania marisflavi]